MSVTILSDSLRDELNSQVGGWYGKRVFICKGCSGDHPGAQIYSARVALRDQNYADIGYAHPVSQAYTYCVRIEGKVLSPGTVELIAYYEPRERQYGGEGSGSPLSPSAYNTTQASASGDLYAIETNVDVNGQPIVVEHTWQKDERYGPLETDVIPDTVTDKQSCAVQVMKPCLTVSHTQLETTTHSNLLSRYKIYIGKLNSGGFLLDPETSPETAKKWMLTNMTWSTSIQSESDSPRVFEVTYTFQWREEGWGQKVVYMSPFSGRPLENSSVQSGEIKEVELYKTESFSELPLSWSSGV